MSIEISIEDMQKEKRAEQRSQERIKPGPHPRVPPTLFHYTIADIHKFVYSRPSGKIELDKDKLNVFGTAVSKITIKLTDSVEEVSGRCPT